VIVSRWLDALNGVPWNSKATFFWSHDLPQPGEFRLTAHKIVFLSEYHRKTWPVPDDAVEIIGDGVDLGLFQNGGDHDRDANRLVWVSNPDRGLPIAAHIFQQVRKRWPDLELHVFGRSAVYGWSDEVEAPFLPRLSDMENVFMHPPLARYALAAELRKAWAVFYPTHWPETYCMATLEAQASGTPVIAPPIAALPETVKGGVLTYDFLNAISQLRNKRRWERLSKLGIEWATENTWDIRARQWIELAERIINAQDNIVH
jgi:glycosyltransferase involved in cell wall biosynthesis